MLCLQVSSDYNRHDGESLVYGYDEDGTEDDKRIKKKTLKSQGAR